MVVTAENRPYTPHGAAREVFYSKAEQILLAGPFGTGKSRANLEKLHLCAEKYAGMRGLILRKTRASLTESGLVTFEEKVLPKGHPAIGNAKRSHRSSYDYPNGSTIVVGGMDNSMKVMSTEYDMIVVLEATELTEQEWEDLSGRLRNFVMPYQQLLADCNPQGPMHWLKLRCDRGQTLMLESRHEDNPVLFDPRTNNITPNGRRYMATLNALTGIRLQRNRYGRWVAAEGAVYTFDSALHTLDRFDIPREWRRFLVVDFGYTNPFVCQWWAVDGDGRMYRYREVYMTRRLVEDHARQIKQLSQGEYLEAVICDHDAEDRATLERHLGMVTASAYKAKRPGIDAVEARLRKAGDEKPRIYYLRDSLVERDEMLEEAKKPWCTEQEFDSYVYPKGQDGRAQKEEPVKEDDHGMDASRYAVAHVDKIGTESESTASDMLAVLRAGAQRGRRQ